MRAAPPRAACAAADPRPPTVNQFDNVTSVVFLASMSEYDQQLLEDESENRMRESLKVFRQVSHLSTFANKDIILFLNKKDLFEEKIRKKDLTCVFGGYTGGKDFKKAAEYIEKRYKHASGADEDSRRVYPHRTCATDTENIKHIFVTIKDGILTRALQANGMCVHPSLSRPLSRPC